MADKLKLFKIELRSVLLGMKNGASLRQLHSEYETRMLHPIPFKDLGFRSLVDLIEHMPDVADLDDSTGELRVYAVADQNTAHIARMVSKQKVSTGSGIDSGAGTIFYWVGKNRNVPHMTQPPPGLLPFPYPHSLFPDSSLTR